MTPSTPSKLTEAAEPGKNAHYPSRGLHGVLPSRPRTRRSPAEGDAQDASVRQTGCEPSDTSGPIYQFYTQGLVFHHRGTVCPNAASKGLITRDALSRFPSLAPWWSQGHHRRGHRAARRTCEKIIDSSPGSRDDLHDAKRMKTGTTAALSRGHCPLLSTLRLYSLFAVVVTGR